MLVYLRSKIYDECISFHHKHLHNINKLCALYFTFQAETKFYNGLLYYGEGGNITLLIFIYILGLSSQGLLMNR